MIELEFNPVTVAPVPNPAYVHGILNNAAERKQAWSENDYFNDVVKLIPWDFRNKVISEYVQTREVGSYEANSFLRELKETATSIRYELAQNDDALCERAEELADKCIRIYSREIELNGGDFEAVYWVLIKFVEDVPKVTPPDWEKHGVYGCCQRLIDAKWWRKQLRRIHARGLESLALKLNHVNTQSGIYVSDATAKRREQQRGRNARILKEVKAINQKGQEYALYDLAQLSTSNPKLRRMELMTRIDGFETFANSIGFKAMFYTMTCPSRMHASLSKGGKRNPKYDGTTPAEAQAYLANQFAKARAELKRRGIVVFGFRVVEPHHDGTPHWHTLFFTHRKMIKDLTSVLEHYALEVDGNEKGAKAYRFKAEIIKTGTNPKTGRKYSAAGYIAKYISKAIDAYGVEHDLYGNDAAASAKRIEAWASTWGIRQFQQIGGASVTVWRELRRLSDEKVAASVVLENARKAADCGDWAEYCRLNWHGQVELMRKEVSGVGVYGDEKQKPIYGVECGGVGVVTRANTWQIGQRVLAEQPQVVQPWTGVNNCTEQMLDDALAHYTEHYKTSHHHKIAWAQDQFNVDTLTAYNLVRRDAVSKNLKSMYGILGGISLDHKFVEKLRFKWNEQYPLEMLYEEFDEIGWGDFSEYVENYFSDFVRDYLWKKYSIVFDDTSAGNKYR